jgi:large subunit ribosomal protein L30
MSNYLEIRQVRSGIGRPQRHKRILLSLGLKGPGSLVKLKNIPEVRGMVRKVIHLLEVREVD